MSCLSTKKKKKMKMLKKCDMPNYQIYILSRVELKKSGWLVPNVLGLGLPFFSFTLRLWP